MIELERLAHQEMRDPAAFLARVEWLRSYLAIRPLKPLANRAEITADVEALRRVLKLFADDATEAALERRLEDLEAFLDVPVWQVESRKELKEFVAQQLCEAIADAKGIPVALLQTGAAPDGRPASHDTLLVFTAMQELKIGESASGVRNKVRQAVRGDDPAGWRRIKRQPTFQTSWDKSD